MDRALFLLLAVGCANSSTLDSRAAYSSDQVRDDTLQYVRVLFGDQTPTLVDYYGYDGAKSEREYALELSVCEHRWGPAGQDDSSDSACGQWLTAREAKADTEPSLYYELIRSTIAIQPTPLRIVSTSRAEGDRAPFVVLVEAGPQRRLLEIHHAADRGMADIGLVWLVKVDGRPIADILQNKVVLQSD